MLLGRSGYRASAVPGGREALAWLDDTLPDLIVLDVMMPEMDGIEVLRRLRKNPRTAGVPVVMFTAVDDQQARARAIDEGANDYWVKATFDFQEFRSRISKYLN